MVIRDSGQPSASRQLLVCDRLRQRRRGLGLTQQQVITRLAERGIVSTNKGLSSLERGAGLDVAKLPELAAALECTVTWLLGLNDDPGCWQPNEVTASQDRGPGASVTSAGPKVAPHPLRESAPPSPCILGPLQPQR